MTYRELIRRERITFSATPTDRNPDAADDKWAQTARHWRCRIGSGRRSMVIVFSMGAALSGEPKAEDVLDCLASDAAGYENADDFEAWAAEYGYDTDSRKAERTYRTIKRQREALARVLSPDGYNDLLWNTERR